MHSVLSILCVWRLILSVPTYVVDVSSGDGYCRYVNSGDVCVHEHITYVYGRCGTCVVKIYSVYAYDMQ